MRRKIAIQVIAFIGVSALIGATAMIAHLLGMSFIQALPLPESLALLGILISGFYLPSRFDISLSIIGVFSLIWAFGLSYSEFGLLDGGKVVNDFWRSLYFSVITWTTVGYGDIAPTEGRARIYAAVESMAGYFTTPLLAALVIDRLNRMR